MMRFPCKFSYFTYLQFIDTRIVSVNLQKVKNAVWFFFFLFNMISLNVCICNWHFDLFDAVLMFLINRILFQVFFIKLTIFLYTVYKAFNVIFIEQIANCRYVYLLMVIGIFHYLY